ncbi:MAG: hypothetical protein K6F50_04775 [Kiritimatiellae bacterium]|nr:hypothetical protein [Kiritimatiellia bacterium]
MRFFKSMSKSPDFAGISRRLLSHCGRREVEKRLEIKRLRLNWCGMTLTI